MKSEKSRERLLAKHGRIVDRQRARDDAARRDRQLVYRVERELHILDLRGVIGVRDGVTVHGQIGILISLDRDRSVCVVAVGDTTLRVHLSEVSSRGVW